MMPWLKYVFSEVPAVDWSGLGIELAMIVSQYVENGRQQA